MNMNIINWKNLLLMAVVSFFVMFALMYSMVDVFSNAYINLNQIYMAFLMTSVMVIIEIVLMRSMYEKKVKIVAILISLIVLVASFAYIRNQTFISDKEFLKSMITHHSSALLMCEKAKLSDDNVKGLCDEIKASQEFQIQWMKNKLSTLK